MCNDFCSKMLAIHIDAFMLYPNTKNMVLLGYSPKQDVLNDYVLGKLEKLRRQQHPKTLFEKPPEGPASLEMVPWPILNVFSIILQVVFRFDHLHNSKTVWENISHSYPSKNKVEMHCELAMQYLASLDLTIPCLKVHQDSIKCEIGKLCIIL